MEGVSRPAELVGGQCPVLRLLFGHVMAYRRPHSGVAASRALPAPDLDRCLELQTQSLISTVCRPSLLAGTMCGLSGVVEEFSESDLVGTTTEVSTEFL